MADQRPEDHFAGWQTEPSTENLNRVVDSLSPTISHALSTVGAQNDPALRITARTLTAQAVKKWKPESGASLATWTSNSLQQLRRIRRDIQSPVHIPERAHLDSWKLKQAEQNFMDEHNRDPDVWELADKTGLPVRRITKIRKAAMTIPAESAMNDLSNLQEPAFDEESMDYIFRDSDYVDRKIIEHKMGYGGAQILTPQQIGEKLKLSPSQLSRRSMRIAIRQHEMEEALRGVAT